MLFEKRKFINPIIIMILLILIIRFFIYSGLLNKISPTIEGTINANLHIGEKNIVGKLESNYCSLVLTQQNQSIKFEFLYKNNKGWQLITKQVEKPEKYFLSGINKYGLDYRVYKEKHIITIYSPINYHNIFDYPKDKLGSNFEILNYKNLGDETRIWFLVLDSLPKDYFVTIGNEKFEIIE